MLTCCCMRSADTAKERCSSLANRVIFVFRFLTHQQWGKTKRLEVEGNTANNFLLVSDLEILFRPESFQKGDSLQVARFTELRGANTSSG